MRICKIDPLCLNSAKGYARIGLETYILVVCLWAVMSEEPGRNGTHVDFVSSHAVDTVGILIVCRGGSYEGC